MTADSPTSLRLEYIGAPPFYNSREPTVNIVYTNGEGWGDRLRRYVTGEDLRPRTTVENIQAARIYALEHGLSPRDNFIQVIDPQIMEV